MSLFPTPEDERKHYQRLIMQSDVSNSWVTSLQDEIERLRKGIITAMDTTHDDDTWGFLNRLLKNQENDAPSYRIKVEKGE